MPPTPAVPDPKTRLRDLAPLIEMAAAAEANLRPWLCNVRYNAVEKLPILERSTTLLGRLVSIRKTLIQIEDSLEAGGNAGTNISVPADAAKPDASTAQNPAVPLAEIADVARELAETTGAINELAPSTSPSPANPIAAKHAAHAVRTLPTIPLNQLETAIVKTNDRATALNLKPPSAANEGANVPPPKSANPSSRTTATASPNRQCSASAAAATNLSPALLKNLHPHVSIPDTS